MVIEDSREYKAAQELERALNDYSWNPKRVCREYSIITVHYSGRTYEELMWQSFKWLVMKAMVQTLEIKPHMNFVKRLLRAVHWMKPICRSYRLERNKGHH